MSALTMGLVGCGNTDDINNNPLVAEWDTPFQTPPFSKIELKHYEPAIDYAIEQNRAEIDAIINNPEAPTFENTIVAMAESGELLGRVTGVFYVLNNCVSVLNLMYVVPVVPSVYVNVRLRAKSRVPSSVGTLSPLAQPAKVKISPAYPFIVIV